MGKGVSHYFAADLIDHVQFPLGTSLDHIPLEVSLKANGAQWAIDRAPSKQDSKLAWRPLVTSTSISKSTAMALVPKGYRASRAERSVRQPADLAKVPPKDGKVRVSFLIAGGCPGDVPSTSPGRRGAVAPNLVGNPA